MKYRGMGKIIGVAVILALFRIVNITVGSNFRTDKNLFEIANYLAFGTFDLLKVQVANIIISYFPIILLEAIFGIYIYQHFCVASVYCFSRVANRRQWYWKEALKLFFNIGLFYVIHSIFIVTATKLIIGYQVDKVGMLVFAWQVCMQICWSYTFAMLINILSIKYESGSGFLISSIIQMIMVGYFPLLEDIFITAPEKYSMLFKLFLIKINPLSGLVLKWHTSGIKALNDKINEYDLTKFDLSESIFMVLIISMLITVIGCHVVNKQEIIQDNKENGGGE